MSAPASDAVARLGYAALLAAAAYAIVLGLYPSLLTLGALVALPVAAVALTGVVAPGAVRRRRALRRIASVGAAFLSLEAATVAWWLLWSRRRPVVLVLDRPAPQRVRVVYDVTDGAPAPRLAWARRFEVPAGGIVHTRQGPDDGFYSAGNPHPLTVLVRRAGGGVDTVVGVWAEGGYTQSGACTLRYDEYAIDDAARAATESWDPATRVSWLDSLDSWGVACREGRLVRAPAGARVPLRRTGPPCYYHGGGLTCTALTRDQRRAPE